MKLRARKVLEDLEFCNNQLRDDLQEQEWRVRWVAICALSRAVGHILHQDGLRLGKKSITDAFFKEIRKEEIFSEFIDKDRNLILKEYEFRVKREPLCLGFLTESGDEIVTEQDFSILEGTYFEDHSPKEAIEKVCEWWNIKLLEVERSLCKLPDTE